MNKYFTIDKSHLVSEFFQLSVGSVGWKGEFPIDNCTHFAGGYYAHKFAPADTEWFIKIPYEECGGYKYVNVSVLLPKGYGVGHQWHELTISRLDGVIMSLLHFGIASSIKAESGWGYWDASLDEHTRISIRYEAGSFMKNLNDFIKAMAIVREEFYQEAIMIEFGKMESALLIEGCK